MQHFGEPNKKPLDQGDLMNRISEMERLSGMIEPELDREQKHPDFSLWVTRYAFVGVEVKRLLMYAEEVLNDTELEELKHRLNTQIKPIALNRFEKYRFTNYETKAGL